MVRRIQANRESVRTGVMTRTTAEAAGGTVVSGTRAVPVLLATFNNTASDPYPSGNLQTELFDGPWPTGTMTEYYREISYGTFTVSGTVFTWTKLSRDDTFYEGPSGCNGICNNSKVPDFVRDTLSAQDAAVNFAQYDNDGPDGVPNSGDDDGFVDFVAFVHPEKGGECRGGTNNNIWSHRFSLSGWGGAAFTTNDAKSGGGSIRVDDYVIMPAVACDGSTMIQIGVFCHEFGHAFGLPDLYDTDDTNGGSEGLGNWCLMAGGSWGGDGQSPDRPVHMSAWAKAFLGWITPTEVTADLSPANIPRLEDNATTFKLPISSNEYYLVYNLRKVFFDGRLPTDGLMVMRVNDPVVTAGLATNRVNADENNQGVEVMEADGRKDLDNQANRGDAGDLYPGSANAKKFDNTTTPACQGTRAVCDIGSPADTATARLLVSTGNCGGQPPPPPPPSCGSLVGAGGRRGANPGDWMILAIPVLVAAAWILSRFRPRRPESAL
jgi:M6 family metalloprotease-like protein